VLRVTRDGFRSYGYLISPLRAPHCAILNVIFFLDFNLFFFSFSCSLATCFYLFNYIYLFQFIDLLFMNCK
jgi:hypothetical protein